MQKRVVPGSGPDNVAVTLLLSTLGFTAVDMAAELFLPSMVALLPLVFWPVIIAFMLAIVWPACNHEHK